MCDPTAQSGEFEGGIRPLVERVATDPYLTPCRMPLPHRTSPGAPVEVENSAELPAVAPTAHTGSTAAHPPPEPPYVGPKTRDPGPQLELTPSGRRVGPDFFILFLFGNKAYKVAMQHHPCSTIQMQHHPVDRFERLIIVV